MRLHEYAHAADVIIAAVPAEHRQTLLAYLVAGYDSETGESKHRPAYQHVAIRCEDCRDLATKKCEDCSIPRAFEDTVVE